MPILGSEDEGGYGIQVEAGAPPQGPFLLRVSTRSSFSAFVTQDCKLGPTYATCPGAAQGFRASASNSSLVPCNSPRFTCAASRCVNSNCQMLLSEWGATGPMLEDWLLLNDTRSLWRQMAVFGAISLESEPGLSSSFFAGQIGLGRSAAQGGVGVLPLVLNATHFALCLGERGGLLLGGPAPGLELGVWAGLLADPGRLEIVPLLELDSGDAKGAYAVRLHALSLGGAPVLNSTEAAALGPVLLDTDSPELLRLPASQFRTLSATFTAQACAAPSGTHGIACRLADLLTTQKSASACLELSEADLAGLATDLPAVALALAPPQQSQPLVVSGRQLLVFERATPRLCARLAFASGNAPALGRGLARAFYMQLEPELRVLGLAPAGSLLRVCGEALSPTAPLVPRFALILIAVTAACLTCLLAAVCLSRLARSYAASSAPSYQRLPTESQD